MRSLTNAGLIGSERQLHLHMNKKNYTQSGTAIHTEAEALAIEALAYLAQDPDLLPRFLNLTGIEASSIREAAQEPAFLTGVLQFFLAHEPTLMQFCAVTNRAPQAVADAINYLPGGAADYYN